MEHLYFDREKAEPSEKREHAILSGMSVRGQCFDMGLCGVRRESGPLSGRKG